jgi:signal transduction histidine kinase/CheY-like chemotaxis protein
VRRLVVHALLACAWLAIGILAARTRGIESPLGYWLYLLPVVAVAQVGARGAVVWAALCIAQFLAFFRLSQLGHSFPDILVGDVRVAVCLASFAATAVAIVGFAFRYARRTNRMLQELADTNASLAEARDVAARADASKTDFLANISHEIRTPMTAILGFAELIAEGAAGTADSAASHSLSAVQRNGAELLRTIDDLLDLSKFEAGRLHVERLQLSPIRLAAEVLERLRPTAEARGLALELRLDGAVPETIQSDPTRLRQILASLVGNAVRFTHSGRVEVHLAFAADPGAGAELRCEVRDTGRGIAPEELGRIRALFDLEKPVATEYRGAGLGLAVCRRILALLGGSLELSSEPGRGSAVRFAIPTGPLAGVRLVSQVTEPGAPAAVESLPRGTRVLLAEDGPDNQKLIRAVLERAGAAVTLAGDGARALELAAASEDADAPFDVILMDMHMPEVDGQEATRRLRARGWAGPIVALTALGPLEAREGCLAAGCDDFLAKPIDRQSLLSTVARLARAGKNRDEEELP